MYASNLTKIFTKGQVGNFLLSYEGEPFEIWWVKRLTRIDLLKKCSYIFLHPNHISTINFLLYCGVTLSPHPLYHPLLYLFDLIDFTFRSETECSTSNMYFWNIDNHDTNASRSSYQLSLVDTNLYFLHFLKQYLHNHYNRRRDE